MAGGKATKPRQLRAKGKVSNASLVQNTAEKSGFPKRLLIILAEV